VVYFLGATLYGRVQRWLAKIEHTQPGRYRPQHVTECCRCWAFTWSTHSRITKSYRSIVYSVQLVSFHHHNIIPDSRPGFWFRRVLRTTTSDAAVDLHVSWERLRKIPHAQGKGAMLSAKPIRKQASKQSIKLFYSAPKSWPKTWATWSRYTGTPKIDP